MNAVKPAAPPRAASPRRFPPSRRSGSSAISSTPAITYVGAKYLGLSPEFARPPGFIVATIVNFFLNRSITFRHSRAPLGRAFVRYCLVAAVGLAVNYAVYSACVFLRPVPGSPSRRRSCRCSSPPGAAWR